ETDRAAPRRAIAVPAIGQANGDDGAQRGETAVGRMRRGIGVDAQMLDAEAVLVREVGDLQRASAAGELRLREEEARGVPRERGGVRRCVGEELGEECE